MKQLHAPEYRFSGYLLGLHGFPVNEIHLLLLLYVLDCSASRLDSLQSKISVAVAAFPPENGIVDA